MSFVTIIAVDSVTDFPWSGVYWKRFLLFAPLPVLWTTQRPTRVSCRKMRLVSSLLFPSNENG